MTYQQPLSSFTVERRNTLSPYTPDDAPGYLVWTKIDQICLCRSELGVLLRRGSLSSLLRWRWKNRTLYREIRRAKKRVLRAVNTLKRRGITKVCLGVSWCDFVCWPGGEAWIGWYLEKFAAAGFDIVPRVTYTPPHLAIEADTVAKVNLPPKDSVRYAEFLYVFLSAYGSLVGDYVELWNEPDMSTDWERKFDPDLRILRTMIALGAQVVHHFGKKAVLGGIAGISEENLNDLRNMARYGLFRYVDVIGFHNLRGTWSDDTPSNPIPEQARQVRDCARTEPSLHGQLAEEINAAIERANEEIRGVLMEQRFRLRAKEDIPDVWLTEYGFPPVCTEGRFEKMHLEKIQAVLFGYAVDCLRIKVVGRIYWYTYQDYVGESLRMHTTGWEDVLQHYFGDTCEKGTCRLLGRLLDEGGPDRVHEYACEQGFHLVDAASLGRLRPEWYTNKKVGHDLVENTVDVPSG